MIKKLTAIAICAAVLFAFCACGSSDAENLPEGMKLVEVGTKAYSLYVPQSWEVDMSTGTISAYASMTDRSNISFSAFAVENTTTLDNFWENYAGDFTSTFGGSMKYINEKGDEVDDPAPAKTTLGGIAANRYVYKAKVTGDLYKFMQITCLSSGTMYILTYTAVDEAYDSHIEEVEQIISAFKFN